MSLSNGSLLGELNWNVVDDLDDTLYNYEDYHDGDKLNPEILTLLDSPVNEDIILFDPQVDGRLIVIDSAKTVRDVVDHIHEYYVEVQNRIGPFDHRFLEDLKETDLAQAITKELQYYRNEAPRDNIFAERNQRISKNLESIADSIDLTQPLYGYTIFLGS